MKKNVKKKTERSKKPKKSFGEEAINFATNFLGGISGGPCLLYGRLLCLVGSTTANKI